MCELQTPMPTLDISFVIFCGVALKIIFCKIFARIVRIEWVHQVPNQNQGYLNRCLIAHIGDSRIYRDAMTFRLHGSTILKVKVPRTCQSSSISSVLELILGYEQMTDIERQSSNTQ